VINHVNVELKTNVSEISAVSIIRAYVTLTLMLEMISETQVFNSILTGKIT
jgi:hypothetical protein